MRLGKEYRASLGGGRPGWVLGEGMGVVARAWRSGFPRCGISE
jgi:hypothetical protein